jgi:uncharacterized protein (TIGR02996 family)
MSEEEAFLRAIQETPEDDSLRLVYADWLEERGDVRGEYLRLDHQLSTIPARLRQLSLKIDASWLALVDRRGMKAVLKILRGTRVGIEYPIYQGSNYIGWADELPVDIDLEDQEQTDRIWSSRQHALIQSEGNDLTLEDLNSSNGTYLNRARVYPGQRRPLKQGDVIQIGTVQMKVLIAAETP